jgi:putative endonuclease
MTAAHELGRTGEALAFEYLISAGYRIIARNWRCSQGEIDLVMFDPDTNDVVFVEVKTRSSLAFGHPLEGISAAKYQRLRRLAGVWIEEAKAAYESVPTTIRIDAVAVLLAHDQEPRVEHHRGVFR